MAPVRRGALLVVAALLAGCGTPPTNEQAAAAIAQMEELEAFEPLLRALDTAFADAGAADPGGGPGPAASSGASTGGAPKVQPNAVVDRMTCDRVDRRTFDCDVTWHHRRGSPSPISGRIHFVRGADEKWTASRATAPAR